MSRIEKGHIENCQMGLPKASGKRRWTSGDDNHQGPTKALCTSPPHAVCAEDAVVRPHGPTGGSCEDPNIDGHESGDKFVPSEEEEDPMLTVIRGNYSPATGMGSDRGISDSDDDYIDDEEDKDSGFIDGNSVDNSSDDEEDGGVCEVATQIEVASSCQGIGCATDVVGTDALVVNFTKVLTTPVSKVVPSTPSIATNSDDEVPTTCGYNGPSMETLTTVTLTTSRAVPPLRTKVDMAPSSPPDSMQSSYVYATSTGWGSCNFYDGSQSPQVNKYMEISPSNKSAPPSQSIQCDENGKSYMELGNVSPPFSNAYSAGTFSPQPTTNVYTPNTYSSATYSAQSGFSNAFGSSYCNTRQGYNNLSQYQTSENATNPCEPGKPVQFAYPSPDRCYGGISRSSATCRGDDRCCQACCGGKNHVKCHFHQRMSVFSSSMYKLNRLRQFQQEASLRRSVLIFNTLRRIERELESEGVNVAALFAAPPSPCHHPAVPEPMPRQSLVVTPLESMSGSLPQGGPLPSLHSPLAHTTALSTSALPPVTHCSTASSQFSLQYAPSVQCFSFENGLLFEGREAVHLRPYTPLPPVEQDGLSTYVAPTAESGVSSKSTPEESHESINWCSVLSLSSQTDLDSVNNNDEYSEWTTCDLSSEVEFTRTLESTAPWKLLPSLSADDVLKNFPAAKQARFEMAEDVDVNTSVAVGGL